MYDKLGDLLNETLDKGFVQFVKFEKEELNSKVSDSEKKEDVNENSCSSENNEDKNFTSSFASQFKKSKKKSVATIYKKITPEVERAFHLLDIGFSANLEDAKKAYKDKLKYYHPDKYDGNAVLKKIATDKTRQVVEAYDIVVKFISS